MVGRIERHEALGMLCGNENVGGVVDTDNLVERGMHHEKRLAETRDLVTNRLGFQIVQELLANGKVAPFERNFSFALLADRFFHSLEASDHVIRVGGSADRHDGPHFGNVGGNGQNRGPAERMADQELWSLIVAAQIICCPLQVFDVGGKSG